MDALCDSSIDDGARNGIAVLDRAKELHEKDPRGYPIKYTALAMYRACRCHDTTFLERLDRLNQEDPARWPIKIPTAEEITHELLRAESKNEICVISSAARAWLVSAGRRRPEVYAPGLIAALLASP